MFNVKGIDHININVKSIKESKEFYEKFFGFQVVEEYEYDSGEDRVHYMLIGLEGAAMLCLYEYKGKDVDYGSFAHLGINVANFEEAYSAAKEADIINYKWDRVDYEHSESFYILDPNGFQIEISKVFAGGH